MESLAVVIGEGGSIASSPKWVVRALTCRRTSMMRSGVPGDGRGERSDLGDDFAVLLDHPDDVGLAGPDLLRSKAVGRSTRARLLELTAARRSQVLSSAQGSTLARPSNPTSL
jgi:hypothetical protein